MTVLGRTQSRRSRAKGIRCELNVTHGERPAVAVIGTTAICEECQEYLDRLAGLPYHAGRAPLTGPHRPHWRRMR